jgi:hypothetical protein
MAAIHLREASIESVVSTYALRVRYETYDVLTDPCATVEADQASILAAAGLPTTLTWSTCSLISHTLVGGVNRYLLDVEVTG